MNIIGPFKDWFISANNAINGILHAAKTERHLRYHFYAAIAILLICFILNVKLYEFLSLGIMVIIVLLAEMMNTAVESVVDMITEEYNQYAKAAKDIAAGAVLITAVGAIVIGYIILFPYLKNAFTYGISAPHHAPENVAMIALVITIFVVIITKAYFGKGEPLQGGMPSGHAAVSFSIWTTVTLQSRVFLISLFVFGLAFAISYSRISRGVHRTSEVVVGAMLGFCITYLLFMAFT